eukprot:TRINITY_DN10568_c0_g1_i1.p1 TRINITY_DN10568_c0_g1~~TRINITY_DN10568_c0_g1_i1.p1  ORF type:complete len:513 (-),score=80.82 TRINITY_DN10568_c0_g1_i1:813-2351(-)
MAFTSRAKRTTGIVDVPTATHVGPGSYIGHHEYRNAHGYAPFCSTAARLPGNSSFVTPGPGTYQAPSSLNVERAPVKSTAFKSRSERFKQYENEMPGPGTYDLSQPWLKASSAPAPANDRSLTWVRIATVPSIPAPQQSYGYEDGPSGELVQQKAPVQGYTGKPSDLIGPGGYNPTDKLLHKAAPTISWARSRTLQRDRKPLNPNPGPGTYEVAGRLRVREPHKPSAAFASRDARLNQKVPEVDEITPGPGAYRLPDPFYRDRVPNNLQFFGSTQKRLLDNKSSNPGPGAYDDPRSAIKAQKKFTLADHGAFDTTAPRFTEANVMAELPGPGAYDPAIKRAFTADQRKKASGPFGTTSSRFIESSSLAPGPGAYESGPVAAATPVAEWQRKQKSAAFASTTSRLADVPADDRPAPGAYDVIGPVLKPSFNKKGGLLSKSKRSTLGDGSLGPGPGAYTPVDTLSPTVGAKSSAFASNERRFKEHHHFTPGPGAYTTQQPLLKRSFNVTIDALV